MAVEVVDKRPRQVGTLRQDLAKIISSARFETGLCIVIVLNLAFVVVETDAGADPASDISWAHYVNILFSLFYTIEVCLKVVCMGRQVFQDPWTVADIIIVALDDTLLILSLALTSLPSASVLRCMRFVRMSKSQRLLQLVPEFHMQVQCLVGTWKPLIWGVLFMLFLLLVFGMMAVLLIHPINLEIVAMGVYDGCARCPHAFESVPKSMLTLYQQLVAGDSWGQVTIPIIEYAPATSLYFLTAYSAIVLALTNVILAAVVDSAFCARNKNDALIAQEKAEGRRKAMKEFEQVCKGLDADSSGTLDKEEILTGSVVNPEFSNILRRMDISQGDLDAIWSILDDDGSGAVDYSEFASQLYKLRLGDTHTHLMFLKHYVGDIRHKVYQQMSVLKDEILHRLDESLVVLKKGEQDFAEIKEHQIQTSRVLFGRQASVLDHCTPQPGEDVDKTDATMDWQPTSSPRGSRDEHAPHWKEAPLDYEVLVRDAVLVATSGNRCRGLLPAPPGDTATKPNKVGFVADTFPDGWGTHTTIAHGCMPSAWRLNQLPEP